MIESFACADTRKLFESGKSRRFSAEILKRSVMRLTQLHAAQAIEDLRYPPSNRLEPLSGDLKGVWSIRINAQWRLCFRFDQGIALDVEILDYH
jgi:proteic killer suppression protein